MTTAPRASQTTRQVVRQYFEYLAHRGDWASTLAEDMTFAIFTSPVKELGGKAAYLQATRGF